MGIQPLSLPGQAHRQVTLWNQMRRTQVELKIRLRRNSGSNKSGDKVNTTPRKTKKQRKDVITGGNANQLKKMYESEGRSMQLFLNKHKEGDSWAGTEDSETDTEVSVAIRPQRSHNTRPSVDAEQTNDASSGRGANALPKESDLINNVLKAGAATSTLYKRVETSTAKKSSENSDSAMKEIRELEAKVAEKEEGTLERMFLEMRLDIKKDNIRLTKKIDSVTKTASNLDAEVRSLKEIQKEMDTRVNFTQDTQEEEKVRLNAAIKDIEGLNDQICVLQWLLQKQDQIIQLSKHNEEENKMRTMRNNLLILGLDEEDPETEASTAQMVTNFFTQTMKIEKNIPLQKASQIGKASPHTVLVQLQEEKDKGEVFKHVENLKGVTNSKDKPYFINNQLTPAKQEEEHRYRKMIKHHVSLAGVGKKDMKMHKGGLKVDGLKFVPPIKPPGVYETVFPLDRAHVDCMHVCKGDNQYKEGCKFIGYCVHIGSLADIRAAYTKVKRIHPSALHIACAYRIPGLDHVHLRGYVDDGEHGAGRAIYKVLEDTNSFNKAVFVVCHYRNKHLGPARFQLMSAAAKSSIAKFNSSAPGNNSSNHQDHRPPPEEGNNHPWQAATGGLSGHRNCEYINATSPHPFDTFKGSLESWGSQESLTTGVPTTWSKISSVAANFRVHANSLDSNTSGSFASAR